MSRNIMSLKFGICFLTKATIVFVAVLNILLLMEDLRTVQRTNLLETLLPYGSLFVLNSYVLCQALLKFAGDEASVMAWIIVYSISLIINTVTISLARRFWLPVISTFAANSLTTWLDLNPKNVHSTGIVVSALLCSFMTLALLVTIVVDDQDVAQENLPIPMFYQEQTVDHDPPPSYTSISVPPNYSEALGHQVVTDQSDAANPPIVPA
jgi:hypothetical protein